MYTGNGFPIEPLGPSHDMSTLNNLIGRPDKKSGKLPSIPRRAGVTTSGVELDK